MYINGINVFFVLKKWRRVIPVFGREWTSQCGRLITPISQQNKFSLKCRCIKRKNKDTCICLFHSNNMINITWFVREGLTGLLLDVETTSSSDRLPHLRAYGKPF